jgi:hypothetical protein
MGPHLRHAGSAAAAGCAASQSARYDPAALKVSQHPIVPPWATGTAGPTTGRPRRRASPIRRGHRIVAGGRTARVGRDLAGRPLGQAGRITCGAGHRAGTCSGGACRSGRPRPARGGGPRRRGSGGVGRVLDRPHGPVAALEPCPPHTRGADVAAPPQAAVSLTRGRPLHCSARGKSVGGRMAPDPTFRCHPLARPRLPGGHARRPHIDAGVRPVFGVIRSAAALLGTLVAGYLHRNGHGAGGAGRRPAGRTMTPRKPPPR